MADQKRNVEFWRESDQKRKKKNRALTTEKKGKIETVFGLVFFFFCWQPVEVEQWWKSNGRGDRERKREKQVQNVERERETNGEKEKRRARQRESDVK